MMDYAVVRTGGKQYRVSAGDLIDVEKLPAEEGAAIELSDVLLLSQDGKVTVGTPLVSGAKVLGDVEEQRKAEKLTVFKFKSKTRQGTKTGHRQQHTRLRIREIVVGEAKPKRRRSRTKKAAEETSDGS
jgi:large subunit ribosomal protein L21